MVESADGVGGVEPAMSMPGWYPNLPGSVSRYVSVGRRHAASAAYQELVLTYWRVGQEILERQTYKSYGTQVIDRAFGRPEARVLGRDRLLAAHTALHTGDRRRVVRLRDCAAQRCTIALAQHQCLLDKFNAVETRLRNAAEAIQLGASLPSIKTLEAERSTDRDEDVK